MQLRPFEYFAVARGLEDHQDLTTYYVRAFIRNAKTDELLATLDLDDQGDGHRFSKNWQVPADTSGEGYYIQIQTSVYEDAGYTTKSQYGDMFETYLVQERVNPNLGMGGAGADIDYKRIQRMISDEVGKIKIPTPEKIDLTGIMNSLEYIKNQLEMHGKMMESDKHEKMMEGVMAKISEVISAIDNKEVTPATDLSEVNGKIDAMNEAFNVLEDIKSNMQDMLGPVREGMIGEINKAMKILHDDMSGKIGKKIDEASVIKVKMHSKEDDMEEMSEEDKQKEELIKRRSML